MRMINIPYRAATYLARRNRRRFMQRVASLPPVSPAAAVPATVFAFSGQRDWPEQAACIRSFLRFVGEPKDFVIVSDGTHTEETHRCLEQLHPCVSVVSLESIIKPGLPREVQRYADQHFLGKKLSIFLSIPIQGPTIYCDSDILFFPGALELANRLRAMPPGPLYLLDCWPSLDDRLIEDPLERESPVNGGFIMMTRPLDWTNALNRLNKMEGDCLFFTEQTLVHLAVKENGGMPLPPDQFVLRAEDQFQFSDRFAPAGISMRHYISSIRTKFWHHTEVFS
jgi:hypothetical protein